MSDDRVTTPFNERGSGASACKCLAWTFATLLTLVCIWSFLKVPYMGYDVMTNVTYNVAHCTANPLDPRCHGPEIQASLRAWFGYRGLKLKADYALFVAPHTAMAIVLNLMFASLLVRGFGAVRVIAKRMIPIMVIFCLHIGPVMYGQPGTTINAACIVLLLLGVAAMMHGLKQKDLGREREGNWVLYIAMIVMAFTLNAAPMGEAYVLATGGEKNATTGEYIPPAGDEPDPSSGRDPYSACGCPAFGFLVTVLIFLAGLVYGASGAIAMYYRHATRNGYAAAVLRVDNYRAWKARTSAAFWNSSFAITILRYQPKKNGIIDSKIGFIAQRAKNGFALWQLWDRNNNENMEWVVGNIVYGRYLPEIYLQAFFELFVLAMAVSWSLTYMYNPKMIASNRLKDMVGYNNICVGFDGDPGRAVVTPFFAVMGYLGTRYVTLDNLRASMERRAGRITRPQRALTFAANIAFSAVCFCLPLLLVLQPDSHLDTEAEGNTEGLTYHFALFVFFVIFTYFAMAANFFEADMKKMRWHQKAWFCTFSLCTLGLCVCGLISVQSYSNAKCPNTYAEAHRNDGHEGGAGLRKLAERELHSFDTEECIQDKLVPVWLMSIFDYGWFTVLITTCLFLPEAPPIEYSFSLADEAQIDRTRKATTRRHGVPRASSV